MDEIPNIIPGREHTLALPGGELLYRRKGYSHESSTSGPLSDDYLTPSVEPLRIETRLDAVRLSLNGSVLEYRVLSRSNELFTRSLLIGPSGRRVYSTVPPEEHLALCEALERGKESSSKRALTSAGLEVRDSPPASMRRLEQPWNLSEQPMPELLSYEPLRIPREAYLGSAVTGTPEDARDDLLSAVRGELGQLPEQELEAAMETLAHFLNSV